MRVWACLAFIAAFTCVAQDGHPPNGAQQADKVDPPTSINQPSDAKAQMDSQPQNSKQAKFEAATDERKKQIAGDSTKLLTLAIALKAEVDKTTKDTLSLNVIRKADEIEKLAHNVREKMKLTAGPG